MFDIAFAQSAPGIGSPSQLISFLPLVLVFIIFYFLLIRPQQKKSKEHQQMLSKIKKNDEVMTSGGIYGKVTALTDTIVTLEIAPNVRIRVNRPQISAVLTGEKTMGKDAKELPCGAVFWLVLLCLRLRLWLRSFTCFRTSLIRCRRGGRVFCRRKRSIWDWTCKAALI
jgi:preprotein translocase subunit YajC